jgi:hypothetical protein
MYRSFQKYTIAKLVLACFALTGCGDGRPPAKVVYGAVTCNGEKVLLGSVSFVPMDNQRGQSRAARIVDGQYRIDAKGGLPPGKYSIQVDAWRKTGRKVKGTNGMETTMIDEKVRLGPASYSGPESPLNLEITTDFDGKHDIVIPR